MPETMKTAFFDVDTQLDFVYPAGALHTPGAETIVEPLSNLTRYALEHKIQVISTTDAHTENDPEFATWKPHCVLGTVGQQKAPGTVLRDPVILSSGEDALAKVGHEIATAGQIIVQKQQIDCFTNPNLEPLLRSLDVQRFLVYGVLTEFCVQAALFGLLRMGFRVEAVVDATQSFDSSKGQEILRSFQEAGGRLTTIAEGCS
jgi:nicotinamidase/pyrazinamidase